MLSEQQHGMKLKLYLNFIGMVAQYIQYHTIKTVNALRPCSFVRQRLLFFTFCIVIPQGNQFVIGDLYQACFGNQVAHFFCLDESLEPAKV